MKTIKEKSGYIYSNGSSGKRWKRGRTMFSEGKQYTGNGIEAIPCIVKTNLDTGEKTIASLAEHKRFLTEDSYAEFLISTFAKLAKYM